MTIKKDLTDVQPSLYGEGKPDSTDYECGNIRAHLVGRPRLKASQFHLELSVH